MRVFFLALLCFNVWSFGLKALTYEKIDKWLAGPEAGGKIHNFHGLSFALDQAQFSCQALGDNHLTCPNKNGESSVDLVFLPNKTRADLGLLWWVRKKLWSKEFNLIKQEEIMVTTGIGEIKVSNIYYYRMGHMAYPVLLRIFDVVIDGVGIMTLIERNHSHSLPEALNEFSQFEKSWKFSQKSRGKIK